MRSFITGVAGLTLTGPERAFLREADPFGFILFKRNVDTPAQVAALTSELRACVGRDAPVLVDQEGGRVQRLGPPHWRAYPKGQAYARLWQSSPQRALEAAFLGARLIAHDLRAVGIDVNCLPIADVPVEGADAVIGDRAYGTHAGQVAAISRAVSDGLLAGGVLPVLKHIPGHGRANADSHHALPVVTTPHGALQASDFVAFLGLNDLPLGMTAHVVFTALDADNPATTSAHIIRDVIRGEIGFGGLLMGDDVSMNALSGTIAERAAASLAAGCDLVLHCNGNLEEMEQVASVSSTLTGASLARAERAIAQRKSPANFDAEAAARAFSAMLPS
jgi:beta-N-acetylhexosaminidase